MYQKFLKRFLDIVCALLALTVFCWLYLLIALLVKIKLGSPVIFKQPRPGKIGTDGKETIFCLYKFRTMTNEKGENGELLPDAERQTSFGTKLRALSLDEIPEAINILKGDMSVVGPRPQLVRDMVFMSKGERKRHTVRPGLTGLAQVSGRNRITWEKKLQFDLLYLEKISFFRDIKIIWQTVKKTFARDEITADGKVMSDDFGDVLLAEGKITKEEYDRKQAEAKKLLKEAGY